MELKPVPLSSETHRNTRIKQEPTVEHVKDAHLASVTVHEFVVCAGDYPILFVRGPNNDKLRPVVMWGVEPRQNLFVKDNKWQGGYVPAAVRCYPFVTSVQQVEDESRVFIGIHNESDLVNEEVGERIFNDDGTESDWFKKNLDFLNTVTQRDQISMDFAAKLDELGLVAPLQMSFKTPEGEDRKIEGLMAVDPKKLEALSDEEYLGLRKLKFLDPIYAHLISLENVNKLLRRRYD
jgi:hypothetical protein